MAQAFSKFFDTDELAAVLERKADMELVRRLQDQKADDHEMKILKKNLKSINDRLKHLSVVQSELAETTF